MGIAVTRTFFNPGALVHLPGQQGAPMQIILNFPDDMTTEDTNDITGDIGDMRQTDYRWGKMIGFEIRHTLTRCAICDDHAVECGLPQGVECVDVVKTEVRG